MLGEKALIRGTRVDHADLPSLAHWFPVTLGQDASVWWRFLGAERFTKPFFQDTLSVQASPERLVCQTPLAALNEVAESVPPTAFIFHVSRCGSTLLTQMLAALPQCIVMSEPPVLDAFFRYYHRHPDWAGAEHVFRQLVAALAQRRGGSERYFFVKFDCWHTPWMGWLRKVFPHTPFIFLYRRPDEVLASHRRQRGPQMVPGVLDTSLLRPDTGGLAPADFERYGSRVLDAIFKSALDSLAADTPCTGVELVNYSQLPQVLWARLLPRLSVQCSDEELQAVQARSRFHSKHGAQKFEGDAVPCGATSPEVQASAGTLAQRCHDQLEKMRPA